MQVNSCSQNTTAEPNSIGIVYRTENADEITDFESFAKFSGKVVPIAPQNAQYAVVEKYNEAY